jgi:uracil-DNA glycosylase
MNFRNVKKSWKKLIKQHEKEDFYKKIISKIKEWKQNKTKIYPNLCDIWETFKYFDVEETKVVLLGQDPYIREEIHNKKEVPQAVGLSFSVPKTHKIPPSLRNMFKELKNDLGIENTHGDISEWVKREKILLLNSALTVLPGKSNCFASLWSPLTDKIINGISNNTEGVVFILLGNNAKKKKKFINEEKHIIIEGVHPSPLSANRGFFGSKIFSLCNNHLKTLNRGEINWSITE